MKPLTEHIRQLLEADVPLGLVFGDNLHIARQPPHPPICVTLYDTGGAPIADLDNIGTEYPTAQIRIRHTEYVNGMSLASLLVAKFRQLYNQQVDDAFYLSITVSNGPEHIGLDEHDRHIFVINLETQRR